MVLFYASWTGHGASTPGTLKVAAFSFTFAVAASISAYVTAIPDALWAGHVASTPSAPKVAAFRFTFAVSLHQYKCDRNNGRSVGTSCCILSQDN